MTTRVPEPGRAPGRAASDGTAVAAAAGHGFKSRKRFFDLSPFGGRTGKVPVEGIITVVFLDELASQLV